MTLLGGMRSGNAPRGDDPYDERDDGSRFALPYSRLPLGRSTFPFGRSSDRGEEYGAERYDEGASTSDASDEDGGNWWDEGLIALLLVSGVILFLFPEPFTSTLGIVLIVVGSIAWLVDVVT